MGMNSATTLGRSGTHDWIIQRVSAAVLGIYFIGLMGWFVCTPVLDHAAWLALNSCTAMRIVNTLVVLSLVAHAWVGVWSILTDYVTPARMRNVGLGDYATGLRFLLEVVVFLWLFGSLAWGAVIIWAGA